MAERATPRRITLAHSNRERRHARFDAQGEAAIVAMVESRRPLEVRYWIETVEIAWTAAGLAPFWRDVAGEYLERAAVPRREKCWLIAVEGAGELEWTERPPHEGAFIQAHWLAHAAIARACSSLSPSLAEDVERVGESLAHSSRWAWEFEKLGVVVIDQPKLPGRLGAAVAAAREAAKKARIAAARAEALARVAAEQLELAGPTIDECVAALVDAPAEDVRRWREQRERAEQDRKREARTRAKPTPTSERAAQRVRRRGGPAPELRA